MASLAVPIRVSGGRIEEGRAHYHATPIGGVAAEDLQALAPSVATALGADSVAIQAALGGVTIDVNPAQAEPPRLLPLVSSLGSYPALTAVAGVDWRGAPVLLNLLQPSTWHLVVEAGQADERSAWLRSMVASLALGSRPSELQMLGVDLTGTEQAFIEALPHSLADVAFRADVAIDLLAWLRNEAERRQSLGRQAPQLVVVVDDLRTLARHAGKAAVSLVNRLFRDGAHSGIHVFAGLESIKSPELGGLRFPEACARASSLSIHGRSLFSDGLGISAGDERCVVRPAHLPAVDLDRLVRHVRGSLTLGDIRESAR